jgi:hypothetical protein
LVEEAAGGSLRRALKARRFLVAFGAWSVRSARLVTQLASAHHGRISRSDVHPDYAVATRPGQIPKLGPIAAGILVEGIAGRSGALEPKSHSFGLTVARALLGRQVQSGEFGKWRSRLDFAIQDPRPGLSEPERRTTFRDYLVFRFERIYKSMTSGEFSSWDAFLAEAESNPTFALTCVGDSEIAQGLFSVFWA